LLGIEFYPDLPDEQQHPSFKLMSSLKSYSWWQTGVIYEVYLRSFQDTNGDGIGDLRGVIKRLDYLQWLGVNILWLTPFYPSPMKDFGYDISDYTGIDPLYGSVYDFDELLAEAHQRDMKLVIDFVPNHTSDQHPWFKEARSSKSDPKRDWYIWKNKNARGSYPNNWLSVLGGSAWEWDQQTDQYYYHAFLKEQPDLNLQNPEVCTAIANVMRFWLDRGIDGFRVDVMWHLAKDKLFRDNPPNPDYKDDMPDCDRYLQIYNCDQPEVHKIIGHLRKVIDEYPDRLLMGEIYLPLSKTVNYYGKGNDGAQLPSNFELLFLSWQSRAISKAIDEYEAILPKDAWPNWVIGNHDRPRLVSRIDEQQMKNAAILLLTLRGTPIMYYGDEIGMPQVEIPDDEVQDPQGLLMPGKHLTRDAQRTPMQWNESRNAGFTSGKPWLRLDEGYKSDNVEVEERRNDSLLSFYKRVIKLRQSEPSLMIGSYGRVYADDNILSYRRAAANHDSFLIVLNLSNELTEFNPGHTSVKGEIVIHTNIEQERDTVNTMFKMEPNSGCVIRLSHKM